MTTVTSPAAGGNAVDKGGNASPPPAAPEAITLTVDGVPVSVPTGTLVIRAAEQVGIQIPRFCDHPLLDPVGACRQCLVEVSTKGPDGSMRAMPKPQASCTLEASEGMSVQTQHTSQVANKAQHGQMEFLLINHPLDCPVCDKGGECPLQNQAMSNGRARSRFEDVKRTYPKPINISTQVLLDRDRCVLCARCTRFSDQIAGDPFIALIERGALQQVGIYEEKPFESYFSGNTVQICPVGALTGAAYRFRSRPFDLISTPSVCEHCASGCSMRTDHRRGKVMRRMALLDPAVNEEWNCDKGRWAFTYADAADRLAAPMVRGEDGELRVAGWPEALEAAAAGLAAARDAGGVGVLTGGRLTVEDAYAYAKFARVVLHTNDIDFRARPHSAEEAAFLAHGVVGTAPGVPGSVVYDDLEHASSVLLLGLEPEEESPMVFLRLRKAARKGAVAVLSAAPFATRGLRKMNGVLIQAAPGTEAEVIDALSASTGELAIHGDQITNESIVLVGERLASVPGALSAALKLAGSKGARIAWIPRRAGERGALEVGALPNLLPGGAPVEDGAARASVAGHWGADLPEAAGRDTGAILAAAASGELSGLIVGGVDTTDLPDPQLAGEAVRRAFTVSLEVRASAVTQDADVVLPVAPQQEKSGTYLDWEGRPRPFQRAIETLSMSDLRVLDLLAGELGEFLGTRTVQAVRTEIDKLGRWNGSRPTAPRERSQGVPRPLVGQAVLATWPHLLDRGRMQDGEPFLAGTAPVTQARISAATAAAVGVEDGGQLTVSTRSGAITAPVLVTDMPDHVVWLPTNSAGSAVRSTLRVDAGNLVSLGRRAEVGS